MPARRDANKRLEKTRTSIAHTRAVAEGRAYIGVRKLAAACRLPGREKG